MLAVKANYQNGKITLLENIPDNIKKAKLTIVVEPQEEPDNPYPATNEDIHKSMSSEARFEYLGLENFFNTENNINIDWEDYFGLK